MKKLISICGSDADDVSLSAYAMEIAERVGELVAKNNGILVCGGKGGVMRAACKGAKAENGATVGILPGSKEEANEFVDIAIPTNLGNLRNYLVVDAADAVIAVGGRWGTLNEISFAMVLNKPLVLIRGTGGCVDDIVTGNLMQNVESTYHVVNSAEEAVRTAFGLCEQ